LFVDGDEDGYSDVDDDADENEDFDALPLLFLQIRFHSFVTLFQFSILPLCSDSI